jgi:Raf kinase inhibitor-like YbhB/YbcL family protein
MAKDAREHVDEGRLAVPRSGRLPRLGVVTILALASLTLMSGGCASPSTQGNGPSATGPTRGVATVESLKFALPGVGTDAAMPRVTGNTTVEGGKNVSPQLMWSGSAPEGTRSWAIAMVDSTPPGMGYAHWLVLDIPAEASSIATDASGTEKMPKGAAELRNDSGSYGYSGPHPPSGTHTYRFVIYAMPVARTGLGRGSSKELFFKAVTGALGCQTTTATYSKE